MTLPRFSVRELLGFVTFLAVGTTSLLYASPAWSVALNTIMLALLLGATLGGLLSSHPARAQCIGFAVFGWIYFILVSTPTDWNIRSRLATTYALKLGWEHLLPEFREPPQSLVVPPINPATGEHDFKSPDFVIGGFESSNMVLAPGVSYPHAQDYRSVGQSLWTLAIAYLGGRLGRYFYLTLRREDRRNEC